MKDWEKLKRQITPEEPKPPPARDAPRQSSDAASPRPPSEVEEGVVTNGTSPLSPPRRGIWEWARAGTGRLNIIGRLPHPEWKSPGAASSTSTAEGVVVNGAHAHGKTTESHDDFSLPSATATEPDNIERQHTAAAAKIEGLGISPFTPLLAPTDFSQTAGSSDDLIANASETTGSPSPLITKHASWTNGNDTTPTPSKPTSPTTPDTPTPPQQRRSDSIMDIPQQRDISRDSVSKSLQDNIKALTPGSASTQKESGTPGIPRQSDTETDDTPSSSSQGQSELQVKKANGSANSSQRRVPTYKIALAPGMFSPAMRNASRSASAASASAH